MMVSLSRIVRCGLIAASAIGLSACSKDQILGNHIRQFTLDHALPVILTDVTQRVVFAIGHMPFLRPSASTSFLMRND